MAKRESVGHRILVWSYERGTWQYDVLCALILAFIFLVPKSCFVRNREAARGLHPSAAQKTSVAQPVTVPHHSQAR